jgi:hypothetical protein
MTKLTAPQRAALALAAHGTLVCAYGNEFFVSGSDGRATAERSTLKALERRGLLAYAPGLTRRGEYRLTDAGRDAVAASTEVA